MPTLQDCNDTGTDISDLEAQLTARRYSTRKKDVRQCRTQRYAQQPNVRMHATFVNGDTHMISSLH